MKKIMIFAAILCCLATLNGSNTAGSIFFADSYMLRASGIEAIYWNPAKLSSSSHHELWLPLTDFGIYVANNSLDLDTYNYVVSRDTLNTEDKERICRDLDGALRLSSGGNISLFGLSWGNQAISSSVKFYAKGAISEKFLRLALYGNTEDEYIFYESNNNASSMAYTDITYGMGDFVIPWIPEMLPQIKAGFSASFLVGLYSASTEDYAGYFTNDIDSGANFRQEVNLRTGIGGYGFKSMLGVYSEITPHLEAGITLDNIFGVISWELDRELYGFYAAADSIYAANIDEDIIDTDDFSEDIDTFSTSLPPELRMAVMYKNRLGSLSVDWVQGFRESAVTNATGRLSFGASILPVPIIPLSLGVSLPNSRVPLKVSYGIGLRLKKSELGLAVQSFDSILPGSSSKGIAFAMNFKIGFR
nr:hypothetical protein [Candidatus Cloacimonadota bacterium]